MSRKPYRPNGAKCRKHYFAFARQAEVAAKRLKKRPNHAPTYPYLCPHCGWFHLTSLTPEEQLDAGWRIWRF